MELQDYLRVIRRSWVLLLVITLVAVGAATAYSLLKTPEYEATTKVFVSTQSASSVGDLAQGNTFTQQVVQSYTDIVTTPIVLDPVIADLDLSTTNTALAQQVTASAALNTVVIEITVTDMSASASANIANEIARSLSNVVRDDLAPSTTGTAAPVKVTVVQPASVPLAPSSPNIPLNIALGLLVGLALGVSIAVLRSVLDTRIRGIHDVETVTTAPVLGGIAFDQKGAKRPLIVQDDPRSPRAESFRSLRTNLQFLDFDGRARSFVVTSAIQGEGKTTTVANLGIALSDAGARVVIVDADMRRPQLAEMMGVEGAVGLSDVLIGKVSLVEAIQPWGSEGRLSILPAGQIPPNPSELLGSQWATDMIDSLNETFDVVLIDAPPLLPVSDAAILSKRTGGAIVVVAAGRTRRAQLTGAIDALDAIGGDVLGVVVTMLPTKGPDAHGHGAGHAGYGYAYNYGELEAKEASRAKGSSRAKSAKGSAASDESAHVAQRPKSSRWRRVDPSLPGGAVSDS